MTRRDFFYIFIKIAFVFRKKDVQSSLALVDMFGCVWVAGIHKYIQQNWYIKVSVLKIIKGYSNKTEIVYIFFKINIYLKIFFKNEVSGQSFLNSKYCGYFVYVDWVIGKRNQQKYILKEKIKREG